MARPLSQQWPASITLSNAITPHCLFLYAGGVHLAGNISVRNQVHRSTLGRLLGCLLLVISQSEAKASSMTQTTQKLAPCPSSPNCVCSDEPNESNQYIAPIVSTALEPVNGEALSSEEGGQKLLAAIARYLENHDEFKIIERTDHSLKVEATTSILRFVDDIDMQVRGERVYVRSASRLGYSDLGKNRRRIEKMRAVMAELGIAQPLSQ